MLFADRKPEAGERYDGAEMLDTATAYRAHAATLYRYALMFTANADMAEDAVQQVFLKLLRSKAISGARAVTPYLRRAVRNECYRLLKQSRGGITQLNEGDLLAPVSDSPADEEERMMLQRALRRLPPEQREVVHMKVYEQMTFQQIADQLSESINTIAGRYRYALKRLRQSLSPHREAAQ